MVSTTKAAIGFAAASASILSAQSIVQFDLHKHQGSLGSKSVVSKDSTHNLSFELMNQQSFFSVDVSIGTPAQRPVTLLIDTGSSDMWVNGASVCLPGTYSNSTGAPSKKKRYASSVLEGFELTATYPSTYFDAVSTDFLGPPAPTGTAAPAPAPVASGIDCSKYGAFNPELSSSWKQLDLGQPFGIRYVDTTTALGVYGTDSLSINGVSVPNTIFAVSTFSNSTQGVLGISLPKDESLFSNFVNGTTYNNLPQTLKADGLISKVSYTLFLNSLCDKSGSLLFGAINPDWYTGELNTVPLVNIYPHFTSTPLEFDVTVNGVGIADYPTLGDRKTITKTKFAGVLDSGTTLMQLPPDLAFGLADSLDFVWNEEYNYFVGGCPTPSQLKNSSVVFNIGEVNYYAPLTNFIFTTSSPEVCAFVVSPFRSNGDYNGPNDYSKYNNYAILGDVLLTSMVVVYDLESYEVTLGVANYEGFASGSGEVQEIISTVPGAKQAPGYSNTWTTWEYITHYSGDESDGIFTNKGEVNPWIATASFGCGLDPTPVTHSSFPANITLATSSLVSSATGTSANATVVTSSAVTSSVASTTSISSGSSAVSASTSVASSAGSSGASAAAVSVSTSTVSDETTTLVTITSCKDHACKTTTSAALVSVATLTIEGTVTEYTTYCPLSGLTTTSASVVSTSSSSAASSASSSTATSSSAAGSSSIPSSIATSTIGSSSSVGTSAVPSTSVATSSAPASTSVSVLTSVNGVAKQIAGSFMAFAAGLVAVL